MNNNMIEYNDEYISFYKLFKAVQIVYKKYKKYDDFLRNQFYYMTDFSFDKFYIDYYDYKRDRLVIGQKRSFIYIYDNTFYVKKVNGKLITESDSKMEDTSFNDLIFKNEDIIDQTINIYRQFTDFRLNGINNYPVFDEYGEKFFLNLNSVQMYFCKYVDDKVGERERLKYILPFYGEIRIDGVRPLVEEYKKIGDKKVKKHLKIKKSDLPDWCIKAIEMYEKNHTNIFIKLLKKSSISKKPKLINNDIVSKKIEETHKSIENMANKYGELNEEKDDYERIVVPRKLLFNNVDDHLEINKNYIDSLKYVDLSNISFDGVLVSGVDFTDTNINCFNPQTVYNKDLSYCSFGDKDIKDNSIPFDLYTDFNGVNLCGTVILGDSDFMYNIDGAITDSNTRIIYNHSNDKVKKKNK